METIDTKYIKFSNETYYDQYNGKILEFTFKPNTPAYNTYGKVIGGYVTIPEVNPYHNFIDKLGEVTHSTPVHTKLGLLVKGAAISIYKLEDNIENLQKFGFDLQDVQSFRVL